jgi:hypothetical protein
MHQTVREFIIRAVPLAAKLTFDISDEAANKTITATLAGYLMIFFTSPAMRDRFSQNKSWSPGVSRAYAEYLNEWPLISYALLFIEEYRDRYGQGENAPELVTATLQKLTENQGTLSRCVVSLARECGTKECRER